MISYSYIDDYEMEIIKEDIMERYLLNNDIPRDVCKLLTSMNTNIIDEYNLECYIISILNDYDLDTLTNSNVNFVKSKLIKNGIIIEIAKDETLNTKRFKFIQK